LRAEAFGPNIRAMKRWVCVWACAIFGLLLLVCGWLMPVHLRAVDTAVLRQAGERTPTLVERGLELVKENRLGAAELLLQTAREEGLADRGELGLAVTNLANEHPDFRIWGGGEPHLAALFGSAGRQRSLTSSVATPLEDRPSVAKPLEGRPTVSAAPASVEPQGAKDGESEKIKPQSVSEPFTEWVVRLENRGRVVDRLSASPNPAVQELLRCRELTNTVIFPPSQSASGQAFDAAISVCGLLLAEDRLSGALSNTVFMLALAANRGGSSQPLEELLQDLMSLGQRFNWGQLEAFLRRVEDAQTLRVPANIARKTEEQLPALFSAVQLSGKAADVARYVMNYSQTGLKDLGGSLRFGAGGLSVLLQQLKRPYSSRSGERLLGNTALGVPYGFAVDYCWHTPRAALAVKWFIYLAAGFLLGMALHFALPAVSLLERPLQVRGFHVAREILFGLGFLVVVLLLSEPFLAQESQRAEFAFRLRLPTVGSAVAVGKTGVKASFMDPKSLLTLLLFFVLQALIYTACLVKLAEIRRQRVPPRMKLKLLENEDHLFDAGLYLGFAGTIISLIMVSLGVIKPSLMAAYSSTSFGIIFVSIFKIFHLRPERRKLLLEAEVEAPQPVSHTAARPVPAPL